MNASKMARHQASIVNNTNNGGGNKLAGLAPSIGWAMSSNMYSRRAPHKLRLDPASSRIDEGKPVSFLRSWMLWSNQW